MKKTVSILLVVWSVWGFSTSIVAAHSGEEKKTPCPLKISVSGKVSSSPSDTPKNSECQIAPDPRKQLLLLLSPNGLPTEQVVLEEEHGKISRGHLVKVLIEHEIRVFIHTDTNELNELGDPFENDCTQNNITIELYYEKDYVAFSKIMEKHSKSKIAICTCGDPNRIFELLSYPMIPIFLPDINYKKMVWINEVEYSYERLLFDNPDNLPEVPLYWVLEYTLKIFLDKIGDFGNKQFVFSKEELERINEKCLEYLLGARKTPMLHGFKKWSPPPVKGK